MQTQNRGYLRLRHIGEMAEWSIAAVLKTVEGQTSGGSNPSLSAECMPKLLINSDLGIVFTTRRRRVVDENKSTQHTKCSCYIYSETIDNYSCANIPSDIETTHPFLIHIFLKYLRLIFINLCTGRQSNLTSSIVSLRFIYHFIRIFFPDCMYILPR